MNSFYGNPHISLSGTLDFLQSASNVEVQSDLDLSPARVRFDDNGNLIFSRNEPPTAGEIHCAYEKLLTEFESSPSIEGSFAICWQPLSLLRKYVSMTDEEASIAVEHQRAYLHRLPSIVSKMEPKVGPDEYVHGEDAAIFIHLSVGLLLLAEQVEGGQSERQWEWLDRALWTFGRTETPTSQSFHDQTKFPRTITLSYEIAKALMLCKSASRHYHQRRYEEALRAYSTALIGIWIANNDIFHWWGNEDNLSEDKRHTEFVINDVFESDLLEDENGEPLSGMRHWDIVEGMFTFERAVKAFDVLIDENARDTDWSQIANICWFFSKNWYLLSHPINSTHIPEEESVSESWAIARGIVLNMMSSDDRIKELRRNRDYQIEDRLRLYFFGNNWDSLPDKAAAALISADREYENTHGRRQGIFEDLWIATREIMVEVLLSPYNEFLIESRADKKVLKGLDALAPCLDNDKDLYDAVAELFYAAKFEDYLRHSFNGDDGDFIKGLQKPFSQLNRLRNDSVHANRPAYKRNNFEDDIHRTYAEFLGIGRDGILPRLMRLHPKSNAKPLSRR